jgi:energy-coupling factor transporter ATP-binding protein EcfA2
VHHQLVNVTEREHKTHVIVIVGKPGVGKSRLAKLIAGGVGGCSPPELENIMTYVEAGGLGGGSRLDLYNKTRGKWWDGYMQQRTVIIDEFYGWLKYDELLRMCDRYGYRVPVKGGFTEFTSRNIIITANRGPTHGTITASSAGTERLLCADESVLRIYCQSGLLLEDLQGLY